MKYDAAFPDWRVENDMVFPRAAGLIQVDYFPIGTYV